MSARRYANGCAGRRSDRAPSPASERGDLDFVASELHRPVVDTGIFAHTAPVKRPCLLAVVALAGCSPSPPLVSTVGAPPAASTVFAVAGDGPAATEVSRQLAARGWLAAENAAAPVIRPGFAAAPRQTGTCAKPDPTIKTSCAAWIDAPQTGFAPFASPLRYRLTLDLGATQIIVTKAGGEQETPLPLMVGLALDRLGSKAL